MPEVEEVIEPHIPAPPPTMRATPKAIAAELEPHIERLTVRVLAEVNQLVTTVTTRLDHDKLAADATIKELRAELGTHHAMVIRYLTTLQQSLVDLSERQTKQGATIRAHAGRIRAAEIEIRRLKAKFAKKGKRRAPR